MPHFLLIYRDQGVSVVIVEAPSLVDAQIKATTAGLDTPNSFRLGQELAADLISLVRPEQLGRILPATEAKELLTLFEARMSSDPKASRRWTDLRAAE